MIYYITHLIRDKFPFIWDWINSINSFLFNCRYSSKLKLIEEICLAYSKSTDYSVVPMKSLPTLQLVDFFESQPEEAFAYFRPHGFDETSLKKLQNNKSFLSYILLDDDKIIGYCFLRASFYGAAFRGRLIDIDYRGRGLGTQMNKMMNEIGFGIGLRIFETVSKNNVASYKSMISSGNFRIVKEMDNNDLYIEILKE